MATATEKLFNAIIKEALKKAQAVSCPVEEYVHGLELMRDELQEEYEVQKFILEQKQAMNARGDND